MKKTLLFSFFISLIMMFSACETDFDIDAEWKEITIVYGLLNQQDTAHYFRINKAFLGGNALEIAKIEDSSSYKNSLEVVLEGWSGGILKQSINFDTCTISDKDSGLWYSPYMVVYKGMGQLNQNYDYKLFIKNIKSDSVITATTKLINDFSITRPNSGSKATFRPGLSSDFNWKNAVNAIRYEPVIRFHYYELAFGSTDTIPKYFDWNQSTQYAENTSGNGEVTLSVNNDAFYNVVANKIDSVFAGVRMAGKVDYIVSAAGQEYDTYLNVNKPSASLVQDRPEYTNIVNGFGLLSSRYQKQMTLKLNPDTELELINMQRSRGFIESPYIY